jgi:hypothetical protein
VRIGLYRFLKTLISRPELALVVNTLPPLHQPRPYLTQLAFVCTPSFTDLSAPPGSPKKTNQEASGSTIETGQMYIAASFLDLGDCEHPFPSNVMDCRTMLRNSNLSTVTSSPTSEIILYSLTRGTISTASGRKSWVYQRVSYIYF